MGSNVYAPREITQVQVVAKNDRNEVYVVCNGSLFVTTIFAQDNRDNVQWRRIPTPDSHNTV